MQRSTHSQTRLLLILIVVLGLALRLIRLDFQPLWWDEGYSIWFAGHPLAGMVQLTAADIHPPLYYALLHGWAQLLGLAPAALRLFSVLAGLPAIPLAYLLGRDLFGSRTGLAAAALVALNPLAVFYSQEIRMYGLTMTFSFLALWSGWRWMQPAAARKFGLAYGLSLVAGLYTLYYFALLPLAQGVWVLLAARSRLRQWLAVALAAGLLYLPWVLYAGPQLLSYVAYKVVQDNDTPLSLLPYLGRHLSAFLTGHLEGPLAAWWAAPLLLLVPVVAVLLWPRRGAAVSPRAQRNNQALLYLALALLLPLGVGFVQQVRAPFLPDRFERVLLFAAPAFWVLVAFALVRLAQRSLAAAVAAAVLILAANIASLAAFYTTPRYTGHDYRPLIAQVRHSAAPGDSVFAVFPWQVGYFWSYLPPTERPAIVLRPETEWTPSLAATLDGLLRRGAIWFPEHLALGAILENAAEAHLDLQSYQLLNRWYGPSTRLTAWVQPDGGAGSAAELAVPVAWQNGVVLAAGRATPAVAEAANDRLLLDLEWQGDGPVDAEHLTSSFWLQNGAGYRWTQVDVTPFAQPAPPLDQDAAGTWSNKDRIAMTIPAGLPPGPYTLMASLLDDAGQPISVAGEAPAPFAQLGEITITPPATPPPAGSLAVQTPDQVRGQGIVFLGHSRSDTPYLTGDDLAVSLFWQPEGPLAPDRHAFLQLLDSQGRPVANSEGPPIATHPTSTWAAGIPLQSQHRLRIPADLAAGGYTLIAGLFDPATGARNVWEGDDYLRLGRLRIDARDHTVTPPSPQIPLDVRFEGGHRLMGYDLDQSTEDAVTLTLYWQPAGATAERLSVFVHLMAPEGATVAAALLLSQSDTEPAQGAHPTTSWVAGEFVTDVHTLSLPPSAPTGPYRLQFGLYDPATQRRLPVVDAAGAATAGHAEITVP